MSLCNSWYCIEVVHFKGHRNIRALHRTTLEITKDDYLTPRGDCIIGIMADKSLMDFKPLFKRIAQCNSSLIVTIIAVRGLEPDIVISKGSQELSYTDSRRIIIRKSSYVTPSTAGIKANKAAIDIKRDIINALREGAEGIAIFIALRS